MNNDRPLPSDQFAEEAAVAAVMVDPDAADGLLGMLRPTAFVGEKHAAVWQAARDIWQTHGPEAVNQITVAHRLSELGQLEDVGGQVWLSDLIRRLPTALGAEHYGQVVATEAHKRRLILELRRAEQSLFGAECDPVAVSSSLIDRVSRIQSARTRPISRLAWDVAADYEPHLNAWLNNPSALLGPSWGYSYLDAATHGMRPCVGMLLARTGTGKSLLMMNIARNVTAQNEYVLMFTTEMSDLDSFARNMYMNAGVNPARATARGYVLPAEQTAVQEAFESTRGLPLVLSGGSWELSAIVSDVKRRKLELGCRVVLIDHLDYIRAGKLDGTEKIIEIMRTLVKLADDLQVCILFVSHSTKAGLQEVWPRLSHAKWAGEKETDSAIGISLAPAKWVPGAGWVPVERSEAALMRRWGILVVRMSLEKNRFGFEGDSYHIQDWTRGGIVLEVTEAEAQDYCAQYVAQGRRNV